MGLPGLGALGVTFGHVVAMDSPNSRAPGDFHWAATLWHELSHVYVLTMTDSRVPRWFTEGLAVYEETAISPEWGDRMTPREIQAIKQKKLLGIADLDRGFVHPTYPEQVIVSYYQGGRVLTFIVEKWGFDAVLKMIDGFKNRKDTVTVVKEVLKVTPEEFDKQFFPWLEADTKKTVEGFDTWSKTMKDMVEATGKKQWDDVIKDGTTALDIYPDFVEKGAAYDMLVKAYTEKGDKAKAIATLEQYATFGGRSPSNLKQLADLQAEAGNKKAAIAALEKLNFIYPKDDKIHQQLGGWFLEQGDAKGAVREFQAALGAGQINLADAHYNLARAYRANKQNEDALEEVYQSLEAAPTYKPAQQLLLELNSHAAPAEAPKPAPAK
jgi:tetratricopeptide (TPR) repeat protein